VCVCVCVFVYWGGGGEKIAPALFGVPWGVFLIFPALKKGTLKFFSERNL